MFFHIIFSIFAFADPNTPTYVFCAKSHFVGQKDQWLLYTSNSLQIHLPQNATESDCNGLKRQVMGSRNGLFCNDSRLTSLHHTRQKDDLPRAVEIVFQSQEACNAAVTSSKNGFVCNGNILYSAVTGKQLGGYPSASLCKDDIIKSKNGLLCTTTALFSSTEKIRTVNSIEECKSIMERAEVIPSTTCSVTSPSAGIVPNGVTY